MSASPTPIEDGAAGLEELRTRLAQAEAATNGMREALSVIAHLADVPAHKLTDLQFLRANLNLAGSYANAALSTLPVTTETIDE